MSTAVYPTLPTLGFSVFKTPRFSTIVQRAASGKEIRAALWAYPIWDMKLTYDVLRDDVTNNEFKQLLQFFLQRQGSFDSFYLTDPDDNAVTAQQFGVGDGATLPYQLIRTYAGFIEPVYALNGTPSIYRNDWQGNQLMYTTPRTNFAWPSEDITHANWSTTGVAKSSAAITNPAGGAASGLLTSVAGAGYHYSAGGGIGTLTSGVVYTEKFVVKKGNQRYASVGETGGVAWYAATFDFDAPGITNQLNCTATWRALPATGWYEIAITFTRVDTTAGAMYCSFGPNANVGTAQSYTAVGTETGYWFSAQHETGGTATSYIKTLTAAVTVTDYTLSSSGLVTFAIAPLAAALLTWTGSFYYRCRFKDDAQEFEKFMQKLWTAKSVSMVTVK